jgi:hypothetical protein
MITSRADTWIHNARTEVTGNATPTVLKNFGSRQVRLGGGKRNDAPNNSGTRDAIVIFEYQQGVFAVADKAHRK